MVGKGAARGRPPKFQEERRPITVTLPERTLRQLAAVDADRARAIAKVAAAQTLPSGDRPLVEVVEAYPGQALIIVGPSKYLRDIDFLRMVEIAPARFLLVFSAGTAIESLELAVGDLLDHIAAEEAYERMLLTELRRILRHQRRKQEVTKAEILLIRVGPQRRDKGGYER